MRKSTRLSKPLLIVSYQRCSTDDQKFGDFTTTDAQENMNGERIERLIADATQQGIRAERVGSFTDDGKTGTNLKRAGWSSILKAAQEKRVNIVVVTYMSRLARGETYHVAEYLLKEAGCRVEMVEEHFTPDLAGRMQKNVTIFADGLYTQKISDWTKTKQRGMVAQGYSTGGARRYGYTSERVPGMTDTLLPGGKVKPAPRKRVPEPSEAPVVRNAFALMLAKDNMGDVQRYLRGEYTERTWSMDAVRRLLTSEIYIGVERFGEAVNLSAHEPIIDRETWDGVQAFITARETRGPVPNGEGREMGYRKPERTSYPYYLRGRIFCDNCGCRMTPSYNHASKSTVRYYECTRGAKSGICPVKRVNAATIHATMLNEIERLGQHPTRLTGLIRKAVAALPEPNGLRAEAQRIDRNEREAQKRLRALVMNVESAVMNGVDTAPFHERMRELQARLSEYETERAGITERLSQSVGRRPDVHSACDMMGRASELWEEGTDNERTELVGALVEEVRVQQKGAGIMRLIIPAPSHSLDFQPSMGALLRTHTKKEFSPQTVFFHFDVPRAPRGPKLAITP